MAVFANQAWVTSALNDADVPNALLLLYSLRKVATSRKIAVVASAKLSSSSLRALFYAFDHVAILPENRNSGLNKQHFAKLFILTMKAFETCIYLSPTMLVIKNCDDIFEQTIQHSAFRFLDEKDVPVFVVRPSLQGFNFVEDGLNSEHESIDEWLDTWAKNNSGQCLLSELKHESRQLIGNLDNPGNGTDTLIYNMISMPLDADTEKLGMLQQMVFNLRRTIYVENVTPVLKTMEPKPIIQMKIGVVSDEVIHPTTYNKEPIAIVGMSCRYPESNNLEEFWNILINGEDAIRSPPEWRWLPNQSINHGDHFQKTYAGFLKCPVDLFDSGFFGISPLEVGFMDPQQRLLHEVVWEGLEDAAMNPQSLKGLRGGVFVGSWGTDFNEMLLHTGIGNTEKTRVYMGNGFGNTAGRISFLLGLTGPCLGADSGCASGMLAVHTACQSLRNGESQFALACGVNLILEPFDRSWMPEATAADGHCKTFDAKADGFGRAEGVGVLVLKRLSDAVKDGDRIWALIRGTGVSQEGISKSLGTPTVHCEAEAMKEALADAGIPDPSSISYVEAHGTGTQVGDPIEIQAITEAYKSTSRKEPLLVGSVKTNVGHTEACSGITGIMKVVLAMKHGIIPAHKNFETLNPAIDLDLLPAKIPLENTSWEKVKGKSRLAGVSSFGITGTDAHAILEEPPFISTTIAHEMKTERPLHIMKLSAKTGEALDILLEKVGHHLSTTDSKFQDIVYTSNVGRADFSQRAFIIADSKENAMKAIQKNTLQRSKDVPNNQPRKVCFLFTGQGSQYPGMARQLYDTSPVFRMHFEYCETILKENYGINISQVLWSNSLNVSRTIYSQTSIFCVEYALLKLLTSWGIKAEYALGHSLGEFAAAVCAGILSVEDAIKLVAERSLLIDALPQGKMLVIKADQRRVDTLMKSFVGSNPTKLLDYAAINATDQTVVAGDSEVILEFSKYLKGSDTKSVVLESTHAFHSKHMDPILEEYRGVCSTIKPCQKTECGFISAVRGSLVSASNLNENYWIEHTREKVKFLDACKRAVELGCTTFIEVGPHPVLAALTMQNNDEGLSCLPTLMKNRDDWETLMNTLGKLYLQGLPINWRGFDDLYERKKVSLPHYPFIGKKYWPEMSISTGVSLHPLLGHVISNASSARIFENGLNLSTPDLEYISDHCIGDNIIFPGAGYLETCLAAGLATLENCTKFLSRPTRPMKLENLTIKAPWLLQNSGSSLLQSVVEFNSSPGINKMGDWNELEIKLYRKVDLETKWEVHATASFCPLLNTNDRNWIFDTNLFLETVQKPSEDSIILELYQKAATAGLKLGSSFRLFEKVWRDETNSTLVAKLKLADEHFEQSYIIHPAIVDAMLQGFGLLSPISNWKKIFYVPLKIGKFVWFSEIELGSEIYVHSYISNSNSTALLIDATGKVLAAMSSVELIETSAKTIEALLDQQQSSVPDLWEEVWRKLPSPCEQFTVMEKVTNLFDSGELCQIETFNKLPDNVSRIWKNLEKFAYLNFLRALYELGWKPTLHQRFSESSLFQELGILSEFRQYFSFICEMLELEGIIRQVEISQDKQETIWEIVQNPPSPGKTMALLNSPQFSDELVQSFESTLLLQNLGSNLANILKGLQSPLAILFPDKEKGAISVADFYKDYVKVFNLVEPNKLITQSVLKHIRDSQQGKSHKLKILEVGAGTGTYSQIIIDSLEAEGIQFEYTFTDISHSFFHSAEKKFEKHIKSMKFNKFNIEEDPVGQGLVPDYFDMVIACDVIHATKSIAESLQNIRILMKSSGRLVIIETQGGNHIVTFTMGALDGYWRFQDFDLRQSHCTLSKDKWEKVLEASGFQVDGNFSLCNDKHVGIVSQNMGMGNATENYKTWLLFHHPHHQVSEELCKKISKVAGRRVISITAGTKYHVNVSNGNATLRKENYEDFVAFLDELQGLNIEGILYCWALDNDNTKQEQLLQPYFNLTKSILLQGYETIPRLAVITNGVVPLGDNELPGFHASTLCGYTKAMKIENFELNCRCVDIVDGRIDMTRIQEIFYELWKTDNETQVAFSGNSRYVPKLMPCKISDSSLALPSGATRFQLILPKTRSISDLKFGHLDQLQLDDGEVEIHVKACSLIFKNLLSVIKPSEIFDKFNTVGGDFAGIVTRVAPNVQTLKVGDQVCGYNEDCNMALPSHLKMSQERLIPLPSNWSFNDGSTILSVYMTSLVFLVEVAKIKKGDVVLIHTATGGVGLSAIAICKHVGCQIIATAGSQRKRNYLRGIGIQNVFNSRTTSFGQEILELTKGRGVDVVLNTLTGAGFKEASLLACGKNARFMELGVINIWEENDVNKLRPDVHYKALNLSIISPSDWPKHTSTLRNLIEKNIVKPLPFVRFDAVSIRQALEYMQNAKHIGKIVCTMPEVGIDRGEIKLSTPLFTERSSYLITGGCGGIGFVVCQWMIERGAKHILLAGRKVPTAQIQKQIQELNAKGGNVIAVQLDVSKIEECRALLENQIPKLGLPPLKGIMHAAGIYADDLIVNIDWAKLASSFPAKISGTMNLHELTKDTRLEFFVIFSSFASLVGNAFQCNYAAANAFEDAFVHYRYSMGLPGMTINWGQWGEAGRAKENDVPGLKPMSNLQGVSGLEFAMKMQRVQTCIPKIDSFVIFNKFVPTVSTYVDERVWKSSVSSSSATMRSRPDEFWQSYNSATDNESKIKFIQQQLRSIIQNTLRIDNEELIENDTNLQEMGMDSLLFIQLRNAISLLVGDKLIVNAGAVRNADTINMLTCMLIKLIEERNENSNADEFVDKEKVQSAIKKESSILPEPNTTSALSHTIQKPSGKPTAPPLLIASGMLGVKSQWDLIAKKIADETNRNVIAFDARCHGESPNLGELSYELMADDIIKLAQFLKIDKFSLLGHSMGGKTAMTVALKHPELLDKLVVVDITPVEKWLDPQAIKGYYLAVHSILSSPNTSKLSLPEVKELVHNALKELDCEILTRDFLTTYLGDGDGRVVWTGKPSLEMVIESVHEVFSFPSTLLKLKYNKPALFIKGENSPCMSDSLFPNTQKIFTNAKLSKIRNAGHLPHLSNTKDFMETVLSFLNKP